MVNPLVRDLYKRFLLAGRRYPEGMTAVRAKVKAAFLEHKGLTRELEIRKAVGKGRYWVREMNAISKLHQYRSIRRRYLDDDGF